VDVNDTEPPSSTYEFGEPTANLSYGGYNYTVIKVGTPLWINATDDSSGVSWLNYLIWWNSTAPDNYQHIKTVNISDNDANDSDSRTGFISAKIIFTEECFHEIKWNAADCEGSIAVEISLDISVESQNMLTETEERGSTAQHHSGSTSRTAAAAAGSASGSSV